MTNDIDEGNDTIKIEINEDNEYKQFFEKGLGTLLSNPHFLLLYVPENGAKMQVIRPANDSYHRNRMIIRINEAKGIPSFYYALSHLWGITKDNRHMWDEIGDYVDDEEGNPAPPVSMRPEKRDTLLALLKDHPDSYWWIDVLCARTDTPLDIMGNIYACCLECIAMIDCDPGLISQLHPKEDLTFAHFVHHSRDVVTAMQCYDRCSKFIDKIYTLTKSQWWKRVWTWQEMALPLGEVRLVAERGTHKPPSNTINVDKLAGNCYDILMLLVRIDIRYKGVERDGEAKDSAAVPANVSEVRYWMDQTTGARVYNRERIQGENMKPGHFTKLLSTLAFCPRRCMDPVDYVYGVLGIFQFEIPRMEDPDAVWKLFLSEMDKFLDGLDMPYRISTNAYHVDLRKVQDMTGVYKDLLEVPRSKIAN